MVYDLLRLFIYNRKKMSIHLTPDLFFPLHEFQCVTVPGLRLTKVKKTECGVLGKVDTTVDVQMINQLPNWTNKPCLS